MEIRHEVIQTARKGGGQASVRSRGRALAFVLACAAPISHGAQAAAQENGPPTIRAGRLADGARIDGVLDEAEWSAAEPIDRFIQTDPAEGAAASARTVVRVLAGARSIVIGIVCEDSDPSGIVSFSVRRDALLTSEDHVRVVLGPFRDGRSGYVFAVNPSGARYDALINPGGETENADWDGIWEAATARIGDGWSAEIRIPDPDAQLQSGAARMALQRPAADSASARNRPLGVPCAPVSGHADQSRRPAHRTPRVRSRSRPERAAGRDDRRRHPGAVERRSRANFSQAST